MTKQFEPSPQGQEGENQAPQQPQQGEPGQEAEENIVNDVFGEEANNDIFGPDQTKNAESFDDQIQQQAPEQGEPVEDQTQQGQEDQQQEGEKILDKFETKADLAEGLENIEQKTGQPFDWSKINTVEDMKAAYQEAQQFLGETSDPQTAQLRNQNAMLRQQLQMLQQQMNQPGQPQQPAQGQQQPQQMQQPQNNLNPQQQAQQAAEQAQQQGLDIDEDEFLEQFYSNPGPAMQNVVQDLVNQELQKQEQQQQQQQQQRQQAEKRLQAQVNKLKMKYPQEFQQHQDTMRQIVEQNPVYSVLPNGMQLAFNEAQLRDQNGQPARQQAQVNPQQQQMQQQQQARKQAARIQGNNYRQVQGQPSYEQQTVQKIFGDNKEGGVFG